jgi:hypothetical protein
MSHDNATSPTTALVKEIAALREVSRRLVAATHGLSHHEPHPVPCWCPDPRVKNHEPKCVATWKAVRDAEALLG